MAKRRFGKVSWVAVTRDLVRLNLDQLERCVEDVQETLVTRLREFERDIDASARSMQEEAREDWYDWNSDRHWELSDVFPKIIRHSMFITSYAFLEHALSQLTSGLAHEAPKRVSVEDLKGDGIDLARAYLKKVQGVTFPDQSAEWNRLSDYRKIRNCLVHADGRIDQGQRGQAIRNFLQRNPQFGSLDQFSRISLEPAAAQDMIRTVRAFLSQLFDNVQAKQRRRKPASSAVQRSEARSARPGHR